MGKRFSEAQLKFLNAIIGTYKKAHPSANLQRVDEVFNTLKQANSK